MTLIPAYSAVLFDLDGVLIDSMSAHVHAWKKVYEKFGVKLDDIEIKLREGEKAHKSASEITQKYGLNLSDSEIDQLIAKKRAIYAENSPKRIAVGAGELLINLRKNGYKIALVTGSIAKNLKKMMTPDEIGCFDLIITSNDVENAKPHPEPYLKAVNKLGISPEQCVVIENAPLGIHSGKTAGLTVIAITSTLPGELLSEADHIVDSLIEVEQLLFRQEHDR